MIGDLTDDLIPSVFEVKNFPHLMLIYYDFEAKEHIFMKYEDSLDD